MRVRSPLLALTVLSACSWMTPHAARAGRLAPELQQRMASVDAGEQLPVLIILREQADAGQVLSRSLGLAASERRDDAEAHLRSVASSAQSGVLQLLDEGEGRGEARAGKPLWLLNAVRAEAAPGIIAELAALPEVDRLLWDPPVPLSEQLDATTSGRGSPLASRSNLGDPEVAWQLDFVKAPGAWAQGYTGAGVVVAIVDTGLDYNHPDLSEHIWINEDEIPDNGEDDDGNGFIDDVIGWDFVQDDNDPIGTGPGDHGTQVAGLAAGDGTSGTATGVAPGAKIMVLRGSGGTWGDVIDALQYAVDNGADIISMSISQKWHNTPKPDYAAWRTIMDNELALGVFHVNSIGNEGDNRTTDPIPYNVAAPGNCPGPYVPGDQWLVGGVSGVVAVGAVDGDGNLVDSSSRGPSAWEDVGSFYPEYPFEMPPEFWDYSYSGGGMGLLKPDIAAPGAGTVTTEFGGGYGSFNGTSAATPQVAGAMAILLEARPELTPEEMAIILLETTVDAGPAGMDAGFGAGYLDVEAALQRTLQWGTTSVIHGMVRDAATAEPVPGASVTLAEDGTARLSRSDGSYLFVTPVQLFVRRVDEFFHYADTTAFFPQAGFYESPDVLLDARPDASLTGLVTDADLGTGISGAEVVLARTPVPPSVTNLGGGYGFQGLPAGREVEVWAIRFGHLPQQVFYVLEPDTNVIDLELVPGVRDDFEMDQGWIAGAAGDGAVEGVWERVDPVATFYGQEMVQPEDDATPGPGVLAFVTGNNYPAAGQEWNDVDGGRTTLLSPVFNGTRFENPMLEVRTWYSNDTGDQADDAFSVEVSSDGGFSWTGLETYADSHRQWLTANWDLRDYVTITGGMRIRFVVEDAGQESVVEAAVDEIVIRESTTDAEDDVLPSIRELRLRATPNPVVSRTVLTLAVPAPGGARLDIHGVDGRLVRRLWEGSLEAGLHRIPWDGRTADGRPAASGIYFARAVQGGAVETLRLLVVK